MLPNFCRHCKILMVRTHTPAGERCYTCTRCRWTIAAQVAASAAIRPKHNTRTLRRWRDLNDDLFIYTTWLLAVRAEQAVA